MFTIFEKHLKLNTAEIFYDTSKYLMELFAEINVSCKPLFMHKVLSVIWKGPIMTLYRITQATFQS